MGKSRVPTVAPQPDLQRVLSGVSEERAVSRPAVAAMGEVEFMFPKAASPKMAAGKAADVRKNVVGGTASRPLEPSAVRTKRVAVSTAQVKIKQEGSVVGAGGPPVRERAVITQNKEPLKAKEAAKPKAPSEPVVVDKKGKGAKVVVRPANAEPLQTTDDEDAPGATNELIPELRVPKLKIAGKAAKLGKTKRVPKVGSAISAAKAKAIKRKKAKSADPKSSKVRIGEGRFTLQVKATKSKGEADEFMRALRRKNFFPHLIVVDTPKKGRFYRIRVGRFETMEEARAFQREFGARSGQSESGYVTRL